jgi:HSP20 family protein
MNLIRYNPNRWFDQVWDRAISDFFGSQAFGQTGGEAAKAEAADWAPRVDVREAEGAYQIQADVPGADRDSLKVEVKDNVLSIQGEKRRESTSETDGVTRGERAYGSFVRKFSLPEEVDGDRIEASYKDGVLSVTLPKKPEAAPKRIAVKTDFGSEAKQVSAA